jgi:hypothetical protein
LNDFDQGLNITLGSKFSLFKPQLEFGEGVRGKFGEKDVHRIPVIFSFWLVMNVRQRELHFGHLVFSSLRKCLASCF